MHILSTTTPTSPITIPVPLLVLASKPAPDSALRPLDLVLSPALLALWILYCTRNPWQLACWICLLKPLVASKKGGVRLVRGPVLPSTRRSLSLSPTLLFLSLLRASSLLDPSVSVSTNHDQEKNSVVSPPCCFCSAPSRNALSE